MRPVHIYLVSTTETSFNPQTTREQNVLYLPSYQGDPGRSCLSTKESPNSLPLMRHSCQKWALMMKKKISPHLTLMTWYGLKNLWLPTTVHPPDTAPYSKTRNPTHRTHSGRSSPRAGTNGYGETGLPTSCHQCPQRTFIWLWLLGTQWTRIPVVIWHLNLASENHTRH